MSDGRPERRWHAALRLVFFLSLLVGSSMGVGFAWRALGLPRPIVGDVARPAAMLGLSLFFLGSGLLATWATLRWTERRGLGTVGLGMVPAPFARGAVGFAAGGATPALVLAAFAATGIATVEIASPDLLGATLPMLVGMLAVSSAEEIALRGYLMQAIAQLSRPWVAAVASGGIFGLMHAGNPGANPAGLLFTGVNGILLAFLVIRTGSLWLACGYHAGWNVTASVLFGMRDSGMVHPGGLAATELQGPAFLTGGAYGFEASWVTGGVEAVVLALLLVAAPRWFAVPDAEEALACYGGRLPVPPEPPDSPGESVPAAPGPPSEPPKP